MEPERKIEKLLRALAKKRREQAGDAMELRPAARQRLHSEIRRRAQQPSGGGFLSSLFPISRPKLAFVFCVFALVCAGLWLVLPLGPREKPQQELAAVSLRRSDKAPIAGETKSMPATPPPALETPAPAPLNEPAAAPPPAVITMAPDSAGNSARIQPPAEVAITGGLAANSASAPPTLQKETKLEYQTAAPAEPAPAGQPRTITGVANQFAAGQRGGAMSDSSLAKNDFQQKVSPVSPAPTTSAVSTNTLLGFNEGSSRAIGGVGAVDKDTDQFAMAPAAASARKRSIRGFGPGPAEAPAALTFKTETATPPAGTAAFDSLVKQEASSNSALPSQHYYRLDLPATRDRAILALRNPAPILTSFRVEQNGSQLRVLDADGSIYTGSVQMARNENRLDDAFAANLKVERAIAAAAKPSSQVEPPQVARKYFFLVTGTNRNLKQLVTFSGNFIPLTNTGPLWTNTSLNGPAGSGGTTPNMPMPLLLNSRISGKAVIGNGKEIDVNAAPARR